MGKMYTKPGPFGDTFLYDENGEFVGRGFVDSHGTTRFTGINGEYIGRSDPGVLGGTKFFDANGNLTGEANENVSSARDSVISIVCREEEKPPMGSENHMLSEAFWDEDPNDADDEESLFDEDHHFVFGIADAHAVMPKIPVRNRGKSYFQIKAKELESYDGQKQFVRIPAGVKKVCKHAFCEKESVEVVVFSEGLEEISEEAFICCNNVVSVVLPQSIKKIGPGALNETGLKRFHIPPNLEKIALDALPVHCLNEITVSEENRVFKNIKGSPGVFSKDGKIMYFFPSGDLDAYQDNKIFPEGMEVMADRLLAEVPAWWCLPKVIFPHSLQELGAGVFGNWRGEVSVLCLPPNLKKVGSGAFGWLKIKDLYVHRDTYLPDDAFWERSSPCIHRYDQPEAWMKFELVPDFVVEVLNKLNTI